jgi:hypothetical protein
VVRKWCGGAAPSCRAIPVRVYIGRVLKGRNYANCHHLRYLMAPAIAMANAQQSLFSANSVLPGFKAVFEEGRGLGRQDTGFCVGAINAPVFLSPTQCVEMPEDVTFLQILPVVVRFIEARPERMDDAFVGVTFEALHDARR